MKLSEAIKLLQETLDKHGDGVLVPHDLGEYIPVEEAQFSHEIVVRRYASSHASKSVTNTYEWIMIEA